MACAGSHSLACMLTGEVYAFGDNRFGQLGYLPPGGAELHAKIARQKHDGAAHLWWPTQVDPLRVHHVRTVSASDRHSLVLAA